MNKTDLGHLRDQIDTIDEKILALINQRLEIGKAVGQIKQQSGRQIIDRSRERNVIERLARLNEGPATKQLLRYIFNVIITATREIQKPKTVSYLGPNAGSTHIAALTFFQHSGNFIEQPNLHTVFSDVGKHISHYGVVPIENSIEGSVNHTLDLFVDFDLRICAEHFEPISHDLLSLSGEYADINTICSHPQALGQCKAWIKRKLPQAKVKETSSASNAALMASTDSTIAAIASKQAAHLYNLLPVETQIEDHPGNITRFLVIGHDRPRPTGHDKTSIMFATSHVPGALFKALKPLDQSGINMLKLESRPIKGQRWSYYFFLDIEGHRDHPDITATINEMRTVTLSLKILGSYPAFTSSEEQS